MRTAAIVVARSGSRRLPGKALLPFAGRPLVGHKCAMLKLVEGIDDVYIGSDGADILSAGVAAGAIPIQRDAYHCDESRCTANEMLGDMASRVDADLIVWAHPTNPLVTPQTFEAALIAYHRATAEGFDSLVSVQPVRRHAWANGIPVNHRPLAGRHQTAAELEPIRFQDGAIFIMPRQLLLELRAFGGRRPWLFDMPAGESADIDTAEDYAEAKRCESQYLERVRAWCVSRLTSRPTTSPSGSIAPQSTAAAIAGPASTGSELSGVMAV